MLKQNGQINISVLITLVWIPVHSKVEGNAVEDKIENVDYEKFNNVRIFKKSDKNL